MLVVLWCWWCCDACCCGSSSRSRSVPRARDNKQADKTNTLREIMEIEKLETSMVQSKCWIIVKIPEHKSGKPFKIEYRHKFIYLKVNFCL